MMVTMIGVGSVLWLNVDENRQGGGRWVQATVQKVGRDYWTALGENHRTYRVVKAPPAHDAAALHRHVSQEYGEPATAYLTDEAAACQRWVAANAQAVIDRLQASKQALPLETWRQIAALAGHTPAEVPPLPEMARGR